MAEPLAEMIAAYRNTPEARRFAALAAGAEERLRAIPVTPVRIELEPVRIDLELIRRWATRVAETYAAFHCEHPELSVEEAMEYTYKLLGW